MINISVSGQPFLIDGYQVWHTGNFDPNAIAIGNGFLPTVYLEATSESGQMFTQNRDTMIYEEVVKDTHGAYNPLVGAYTVPFSGYYLITATIGFDVSYDEFLISSYVYINGIELTQVFYPYSSLGSLWLHSGYLDCVTYCNPGDIIEAKFYVSEDQNTYPVKSLNRLTILKVKDV